MRISVAITLCLLSVLGLGLLVSVRTVLHQQKTISDLRDQMGNRMAAAPPEAAGAVSPTEPSLRLEPDRQTSNTGPLLQSVANQAAVAAPAVIESLRQQNDSLNGRIRELEEELTQTRKLVPEAEDPEVAYVGPGTWLNSNAQTAGITKIIISGDARSSGGLPPKMTIAAWGRCSPSDCEWGEVPFYLLNVLSSQRKYRRGLGVWETEGWRKYVIVVFEKGGLKAECISVAKQPGIRHQHSVETMISIN